MDKPVVLITGGGGMIGQHLTKALLDAGFKVSHLSRTPDTSGNVNVYTWNPEKGILKPDVFKDVTHIIHLAGANIGESRWSVKQKQRIIKSRVDSARLIHNVLENNNIKINTFISASGVNYYGTLTTEKIFGEDSPPANDFLGSVCRQWEEAADMFASDGVRVVKLRTAVVLDKNDNALKRIVAPARFGFLGMVGNGAQHMPWIHHKDLTGIYMKAVTDTTMKGVYNAVSPHHVTHRLFMETLSQVLKKPVLPIPVPAFILKVIFGEMAGLVLEGSRISSDKIINEGYRFSFDNLQAAFEDLYLN